MRTLFHFMDRQMRPKIAALLVAASLLPLPLAAWVEVRQTHEAVLQQERLRASPQMASGMAPDINDAISSVALYTESLLKNTFCVAQEAVSPSTPVILLTGCQRLVAERDIPPHVDHVLNKPPKLSELRAARAHYCHAAGA